MNVVFDFGAVLFDWRPVDFMMECFPQSAPTLAEAAPLAHAVFGHAQWQEFDRGAVPMSEVVRQTASRVGLDSAVLGSLVESIGQRLTPMADTLALFQHLVVLREQQASRDGEPLRLYYLSNMPVPYARTLEQTHDFLKSFDGGIFSGDVRLSKPQLGIYQLLQSRYQLAPERTVFIDDLQGHVDAAIEVGWKGIHFTSAAQLAKDLHSQCGL
jgi:putative hydrolase of the HAD superfamily